MGQVRSDNYSTGTYTYTYVVVDYDYSTAKATASLYFTRTNNYSGQTIAQNKYFEFGGAGTYFSITTTGQQTDKFVTSVQFSFDTNGGTYSGSSNGGFYGFSGSVAIPAYVYPAPTNVSINPVQNGRTAINLNRNWSGATYCQYNINNWGWIAEGSTYSNGVKCNGNDVTGLTANTTYSCQIRMGNHNSGLTYSSTKSATTSGNAPSITGASASASRTEATFSYSGASYDTNASYSKTQYSANNSSWSDGNRVGNLTPNTSYTYYVRIVDNWGRASGSKSAPFTTTGNAPTINSVSKSVYRNKCELGLSVSYDTNASYNAVEVQYGTSSSYGSSSSSTTLSSLSPNTTYHYKVRVKDNWGRWSSWTSDATFKTSAYLPSSLSISMSNILPFTAKATVSGSGDTNAGITNYTYYYTVKPSVNTYDMPIKSFGGARWARIYYHNSKQGSVVFSSLSECKNVQAADKYSRLGILDSGSTYKINGKYEFMLEYPIDAPGKYNRWKQTNAPQNDYITPTSAGTGTATGYEAVHIDWSNNYWGGLARQNESTSVITSTWLSGSVGHSNWFYAIGPNTTYQRGVPSGADVGAFGSTSENSTADVVELWIRIPDGSVTGTSMGTSTTANVSGLSEETTYLFNMSAANAAGTNYSTTVEVTTPADQAKIRIKDNGTWKKGKAYYKSNGEWVKAKKIYIKVNGEWVIGYNYENN